MSCNARFLSEINEYQSHKYIQNRMEEVHKSLFYIFPLLYAIAKRFNLRYALCFSIRILLSHIGSIQSYSAFTCMNMFLILMFPFLYRFFHLFAYLLSVLFILFATVTISTGSSELHLCSVLITI